ncbi:MAG: hypothetical protein QXK49_02515 [Candidatus Aenigmatarchaeota archaeon]
MNKSLISSFLIFFTLFSISVFAIDFPCAFYGKVKIGDTFVSGTLVKAYLNDTGEYLATAQEIGGFGNYTITIENATNLYVKFKIGVIDADQSEMLCLSGKGTYLDLTATPLSDNSYCTMDIECNSTHCVHNFCRPTDPFIGDGYCDHGENCANSVDDCKCPPYQLCNVYVGVCFTPSSGGGGGGGGLPSTCTEDWFCEDWSDCINGVQTRKCTDLNNCGTTKNKPLESRSCEVIPIETPSEETSTETIPTEVPEEQAKTPTEGPTGFFLGLSTTDWIIAIVLGIVVAVVIIFFVNKKRKRK